MLNTLDNTIKIWDISSRSCQVTLSGHSSHVNCLQLLPYNKLASCSWDNTIKIWDIASGGCLATLNGHSSFLSCLQLLPGNRLASGSYDKTIKVWDINALKLAEQAELKDLDAAAAGCRLM